MGGVGVEPTRIAPTDLKPVSLTTRTSALILFFLFLLFLRIYYILYREYSKSLSSSYLRVVTTHVLLDVEDSKLLTFRESKKLAKYYCRARLESLC